ncbi:cytidine deaminase [Pseudoalteromonas phenolica]|uniref:Cytidine deaminase n=1 Tax=Pseudoalteromonas phenolica TaxID=161398 RepID=A0A0S2K8B5_9GAMM|nr:cytidine deaminase [Pseudoalteromonas phenolica]ALO44587.1 Cytidine deaminase [Pseudoalteromonas phenolica]MBE0357619.1 cytidine deaminase [Pseudoalteromonas phenolica O-BC30]RXF02619.1 cytidine deaminase [Pseudoalteromonas phenolica O-BC30]TMO55630.1 cytidine deaminase [Pseudoalteromonas phenolica]
MLTISKELEQELQQKIQASGGVIEKSVLDALMVKFDIEIKLLLQNLLPIAASFSIAPISNFNVGAIAYSNTSGCAYIGSNLEFNHSALCLVVHAEQSAINTAWLNGETQISHIAITDAPCGHCRQFINEVKQSEQIEILLPNTNTSLTELLPHSFGPADLGNQTRLLDMSEEQNPDYKLPISQMLFEHYQASYAPYSGNKSAVEIRTVQHGNFYGRYAENVAYNPSLSPLQSALSQMALSGLTIDMVEVTEINLVETEQFKNQSGVSEVVLNSFEGNFEINKVYVS